MADLFIVERAAHRFERELDLTVMVAFVPDHVLEHEDRMVVVPVHVAARLQSALDRIPHRQRAVVQHRRDSITVMLRPPLSFGQRFAELGSILVDEHESHIVDVHEQLRGGRTAVYRPGVHPAVRERAQQIDQDRVVSIPGVQQSIEQRTVLRVGRVRSHAPQDSRRSHPSESFIRPSAAHASRITSARASMAQPLAFLADGGNVGALMRSHDWSTSPLGPPDAWPQSLKTVVGLLLQSRFPMFVAWGKDLGFLYNDPYAEILGAKHPRALGKRFYDIWSEIWSDISPLIDAAMAGQASYREDLPLVMNRKGYDEQTWFTFSYSPVRDESGKVAGMFCACSETTQKVLAERALREGEGRLRALVAASSYAIYRMSPDWSHMLALEGQGFIADTNSPSGAWLGDYIHPDDRARVTAAIQEAIASKSLFELEHRVRRIDGTLGWTLSRAVPLVDASGNITEWFGAASDVTARKNAEAALRDLNETLERRVTEALAERKILADIVEGTNAFVQVVDLGYRWLAINNAAATNSSASSGSARRRARACSTCWRTSRTISAR